MAHTRTAAPGTDATFRACDWIDARLLEIERGKIDQARDALRARGIRQEGIATADMTEDAGKRAEGWVNVAFDALRWPMIQPEAATRALHEARKIVTM